MHAIRKRFAFCAQNELSITFMREAEFNLILESLLGSFFFLMRRKMSKSFIDVIHDSPRTGLGIPFETKKPPLSNQYTARGTAFRL